MKFNLIAGACALTVLAAGAGVAYLATREDGRKYLAQASLSASRGVEVAGKVYDNAKHAAGTWIENYQRSRSTVAAAFPFTAITQNGSAPHKELTFTH